MKTLHPKVLEHKRKALPINSRSLSVNASGSLTERVSLLDKRIIEGYGVMFNEPNMHREVFPRGAYAKTIRENGPGSGSVFEMKFNHGHDVNNPLALFDVVEERQEGLYFRTKPLEESEDGDKVLRKIRSGLLNNFSQEFLPVWEKGKVEWDEKRDLIVFKEVQLFGIGVVGTPSDRNTYAIRSVDELDALTEEAEEFIRSLPKRFQIEAREIFARHKALIEFEPLQQDANTLETGEPQEPRGAVSTISLLNNFKL